MSVPHRCLKQRLKSARKGGASVSLPVCRAIMGAWIDWRLGFMCW